MNALVRWWRFRRQPERLLFITRDYRTSVGQETQDYYHRLKITRVVDSGSQRFEAWGKIMAPATGPGTIGEQKPPNASGQAPGAAPGKPAPHCSTED